MAGSFRFEPPSAASGVLTRPRLLRVLLARWDRRVVTVVGGAGLGKTTLLAQAVAENHLAPRGEDVWAGLQPGDADADVLARTVATAVGDRTADPDAGSVAAALWRRAPSEACLVVDDVHVVAAGSAAATWLGELVAALPANGHLVLAGRTEPPAPLARLRAQGLVAGVTEDDLRFTAAELDELAARHGVDADRFHDLGGWPAMAVLAATVERRHAGGYLWEEVLEPLGPARRRVLAVVTDLGAADDDLASAALAEDIDLARALAGVPLVAAGDDGTHIPHPLWRSRAGLALEPGDRAAVRRRAVAHLLDRHRFDEAFRLAADAGQWDEVPAVLLAACTGSGRPTAPTLRRWLDACPAAVVATAGGSLASALLASYVDPATAVEPMRRAAERCRAEGDADGELSAIAELGRLAWWHQNLDAAVQTLGRVEELAGAGHPLARGLAGVGRVVFADLAGDDEGALAALDAIEPGTLDRGWEASMRWFRARILCSRGHAREALAIIDGTDTGDDRVLGSVLAMLRLAALWALGQVDDVLEAMTRTGGEVTDAGVAHNRRLGEESGAILLAHVGRATDARQLLAAVDATLPEDPRAEGPSVRRAVADAALALAEGEEAAAAGALRAALGAGGIDSGARRREWRTFLPMTYVLVPETREPWDAAPFQGTVATARTLARGVVGARDVIATGGRSARNGPKLDELRGLEVPDPHVVRANLHVRFAAELAVGLGAAGRPEAEEILRALGPSGRDAVRDLGAAGATTHPARALLAAVPAPPPRPTWIAVLGSLEVRRDGPGGEPVTDADLRRERVRALLAFLVRHRSTTRAAAMAALWPDLDERAAANNLRVTLTYLTRVLEPWRPSGEPGYLVRTEGPCLELVVGDHLLVDADRFDHHVAAAARAERDGSPSVALDHGLAAVGLHRGELWPDLHVEWLDLDRELHRSAFVAIATRTAQLLLARGDGVQAEDVARRALDVDRWAEDAYGVLTGAALTRGDRSAARRQLDRGLAALAELGLEPSDATRRLTRLVRGAGAEAGA